ncbi:MULTISPECIES: DUF6124 family protein [Pseudomonas]|jgi:hypothetical protein|uniref:Uncharacterized protein n=1 Tax=Pseudomonas fluorescens TaxID=294 RepID=A0A0F4TGN0_PSEFL|nr:MULTISPECIES: hypothetical protein [Pseudomonas]KJZ43249.1 hypothetical protein VC35_19925 [Pseudomonas fluorescens]MBI3907884.1 hypothetical protein [Pseudomonas fluorescens]
MDKLIPDPPYNTTKPYTPNTMFMIVPDMDTESLLAHACESLASANVMASDFARKREKPCKRKPAGLLGQADHLIKPG